MSPSTSTLDHEKPEAVFPQVFGLGNNHSVTPDIEYAPSIDRADHLEERRERRGESVW